MPSWANGKRKNLHNNKHQVTKLQIEANTAGSYPVKVVQIRFTNI